jgi:hypothetical protein
VIIGAPIRPILIPWEPTTTVDTPCYLFIIPANAGPRAGVARARVRWKYEPTDLAGSDGTVVTITAVKYFSFAKSASYTRPASPLTPGDYVVRPYIGNLDDADGITAQNGIRMTVRYVEDGNPIS